jgi:uncharacterized membrane protein
MDNNFITLLLRLIHILAGIFWVGVAFLMAGFVLPALRESGMEGGRFMQQVMVRRRLPLFLGLAMLLTLLSGLTMYARLASATHGTWASTRPGIAYGVGGLVAIVAAIVGFGISGTAGRRMMAIGQRVAEAGGPTAEQQDELARLQDRSSVGMRIAAGLLAVAAGAMAIARYL